jgi:hypothetical protein
MVSYWLCCVVLPSPRPWDFPPSIDGDVSRVDDPMELDDPELLPSPRPWDFPPSIDGDISHADDPMELDDPE